MDMILQTLELFRSFGCPHCSGDCSAENPPRVVCPMRWMEGAIIATKELQRENFALAAGQCCVPSALVGDEGGTTYCKLKRSLSQRPETKQEHGKEGDYTGSKIELTVADLQDLLEHECKENTGLAESLRDVLAVYDDLVTTTKEFDIDVIVHARERLKFWELNNNYELNQKPD